MPGLEMPARGGGAAMLRDLRDEERTRDEEPVLTDVRTSVSTDARKQAPTEVREHTSTEVSPPASADGGTRARKGARKQVSTPARASGRTAGRQDAKPVLAELGFLETVEAVLASREPLIGGVKATVDMSPELSTRAKRYLADHRGQNTRQVLIALFDTFLSIKGY